MAQMEGEKAVEIFDLVVRNKMLPEKLDDLVPMSFMGQAAVEFYRTKVKALKDLGMSERQQKETLGDGQDAGKMLLTIEDKIGELSYKEQPAQNIPRLGPKGTILGVSPSGKPPKHERIGLPNYQSMKNAQRIHRNPDVVERVIKEAEANEDIPTKTAVLTRIALEKEKKRREAAEGKRKEIKAIIAADQIDYLLALDKCISALPQKPPKTWNEAAFAEAKAKARIIIRRLEVFND